MTPGDPEEGRIYGRFLKGWTKEKKKEIYWADSVRGRIDRENTRRHLCDLRDPFSGLCKWQNIVLQGG